MLSNILSVIIVSITLVIVLTSTPLNIGLWIIFTTIIISISISVHVSSWFSFILFLVYVGGLLVIFAYFVSIQPNQQIKILKIVFTFLLTACLFIPIRINYITPSSFEQANTLSISELLCTDNIQILILLAITLFLALVAVVKITKIYIGPLRPFKYVLPYSKNSSLN